MVNTTTKYCKCISERVFSSQIANRMNFMDGPQAKEPKATRTTKWYKIESQPTNKHHTRNTTQHNTKINQGKECPLQAIAAARRKELKKGFCDTIR
jgi:hypothetical protein